MQGAFDSIDFRFELKKKAVEIEQLATVIFDGKLVKLFTNSLEDESCKTYCDSQERPF